MPRTFREAVQYASWRDAMALEFNALERNHTWDITDLPPNRRALGCQWVYRTKYKSDGTKERDKARLVVLGNHQEFGVDFTDTFAPVAKLATVRVLLSVAVARGWQVDQLDVNNAFLHGELTDEIYMKIPPGYTHLYPGKVCRLRKSLYGLRQSPRNWFAKLRLALRRYGFRQAHADHTLFVYRSGPDMLVVLVYVDDILVAGNNSSLCTAFKKYLDECFNLKDLGPVSYFLGIECARSQGWC